MKESVFQRSVIELARTLGWLVHAERPARTAKGWRTPIQGDAGFPDLVLARNDGRLIFAELKQDKGRTTADQDRWLATLATTAAEIYTWRPKNWDEIMEVLQ